MKLLLSFLTATIAAWPAATMVSLRIAPAQASLKGASATQQFVAIAKYADGTERDVTDQAEWRVSNPSLAKFISTGRIAPLADGTSL